jgi:hypothetical protein
MRFLSKKRSAVVRQFRIYLNNHWIIRPQSSTLNKLYFVSVFLRAFVPLWSLFGLSRKEDQRAGAVVE